MENKMPFLGIINCRNLWKIDYHLHVVRASFSLCNLAMCFLISTLHFSVFITDIAESFFYKKLNKGFKKAAGALCTGSLIMN